MNEPRRITLAYAMKPGYGLFAAWMRRNGRPSLRHAVVEPDDQHDPMVTVCGREVPDDADLEALLIKTPHDMDEMLSVCRRCRVTRQMMSAGASPAILAYCYPTDCVLCQERVLDPGRMP